MPSSTLTATLTYTPPLATSTTSVSLNVTETYAPMNVGTIDIPIGTLANIPFAVPFGSIGTADVLVIKNRNNQDMGVRLNTVPPGPFVIYQIPPNGMLMINHPTASGGTPLTSADVDTTVVQAGQIGYCDYYVLGST